MECGPVSQRSGRWKRASALLFLIVVALLFPGEAAARGSLLVFPLTSHWLTQPLAEATTAAISDRLVREGYTVAQISPASPVLQLAVSEEWIPAEAVQQGDLAALRDRLGIATGADAALFGEVIEREAEVVLRITLSATISGQEVRLEASAPRAADPQVSAAGLAEELAVALTPMTWGEIGADAVGKRQAAAGRYAAGQAAMAAGMYQEAVLDFEAALLAEPGDPDYLRWDAAARQALGDYSGAVVRMRSLAAAAPSDAEISLQLGNAALAAGRPAEAEAAFLQAAEGLGRDPRVVEGLALACKAQGKYERAEEYYQVLLTVLPALAESPPTLARLLANSDVPVHLSDVPADDIGRELGRFYLVEGYRAQGIAWLLSYHRQAGRPAYGDDEYLDLAASADEEAKVVEEEAERAAVGGQLGGEQAAISMDALHDRSEALATLAERMQVSAALDPAHRYRVLAYNLLNQSNFEALIYLQSRDAERRARSDLLRDAFRKSLAEAQALTAGLLGSGREG